MKPTPKQIVKFCRQEAALLRAMRIGAATLKREGYPDLSYRTPAEIEGFADFVEQNNRVPAVWPKAPK